MNDNKKFEKMPKSTNQVQQIVRQFLFYMRALFKYRDPIHLAIDLLFPIGDSELTLNQLFYLTMAKEIRDYDLVENGYMINLEHPEIKDIIKRGYPLRKAPERSKISKDIRRSYLFHPLFDCGIIIKNDYMNEVENERN